MDEGERANSFILRRRIEVVRCSLWWVGSPEGKKSKRIKVSVLNEPLSPVVVRPNLGRLDFCVVDRESRKNLSDDWSCRGVYVLLSSRPTRKFPTRFRAYVGEVTKSTFQERLNSHDAQRQWWSQALLIRLKGDDLTTPQINWLEGRLYDLLLSAAPRCVLENKARPGDDSIKGTERKDLEDLIPEVSLVMRAIGFPPDSRDQIRRANAMRGKGGKSVATLLGEKVLSPGQRLYPNRAKLSVEAEVQDDGTICLVGGKKKYGSPSDAAQAASGNKAEPGWDFWCVYTGDGSLRTLNELFFKSDAAKKHSASLSVKRGTAFQKLFSAGVIRPEDVLVAMSPKYAGQSAVVEENGFLRVGNRRFSSVSAAAKHITKNKAQDGNAFWGLQMKSGDAVSLKALAAAEIP